MYRRNETLKVRYYSALLILAGLSLSLVLPTRSIVVAAPDKATTASDNNATPINTGYGKRPLLFEMNKGQTDERVKFVSRGSGYTLYLADSEAAFSLKTSEKQSDVVRMRFAGGNPAAAIEGEDQTITKTNYYIGTKSLENIPNYRQVRYCEIYKGVDAIFYGNADNQLEYDLVVAPGADPSGIELYFEGAHDISVNETGALIIKTAHTELLQPKPFTYQETNGVRIEVASRYIVSDKGSVGFELGAYDRSKPLVIDPVLKYLTYIGGNELDQIEGIETDDEGNVYIAGSTDSLNFHGQIRSDNDKTAAFAAKIDPTGTDLLYLTVLEGVNRDLGEGITIDNAGNVYVIGEASHDFPTTPGAYDSYVNQLSDDGFLTKLNSSGAIVFSTLFGGVAGDDLPSDIAVDSSGKAYIAGTTHSGTSFPQKNRYKGCGAGIVTNTYDAFLTVFNSTGTDVTYSTCFGGNVVGYQEEGFSIALDPANNAYIAGRTNAGNFPTKNAFQPEKSGGIDAFVTKLNPASSGEASLVYSTFLGGGGTDEANGIAVNSAGEAYVTGITGSVDFPLQNAFRSTNQVNEAFVSVIGPTGSQLLKSSFLGGTGQEEGEDIVLGVGDLIYVTGHTASANFPVSLPFQATKNGGRDTFVTKLKFGTGVITSTFLGGNGDDFGRAIVVRGDRIHVAGETQSSNLGTTAGVIKPTSAANATNPDGFVARILDTNLDSVGVFRPTSSFFLTQSTTTVVSQQATFTSSLAGQKGVSGDWNGDGVDSIGSFTTGTWKVRDTNFPLIALPAPFGFKTSSFGAAGDLPVAGDWDGDGIDTLGVFRPSTGQFTLTDSTNSSPPFTISVTRATFGAAGDLPISGDWDGDGKDSIAVYRPSTGETFFTNDDLSTTLGISNNVSPGIDIVAFLGVAEDLPIGGDWNGDGRDSLGLWRPSTAEFILSDDNVGLRAVFVFGQTGDQPIVGDWDGKPNP